MFMKHGNASDFWCHSITAHQNAKKHLSSYLRTKKHTKPVNKKVKNNKHDAHFSLDILNTFINMGNNGLYPASNYGEILTGERLIKSMEVLEHLTLYTVLMLPLVFSHSWKVFHLNQCHPDFYKLLIIVPKATDPYLSTI